MCRRDMCAGTFPLARRLLGAGRGKWLLGDAVDGLVDAGADLRTQVAGLAPHPAAVAAHLALHARAVAAHGTLDTGAALTQLTLDAGTSFLELALDPVASGGAAALEAPQVTLDLAGCRLRVEVRPARLDHVVTRDQGGADRDEQRALGVILRLLQRCALVQLAGGRSAFGGCAPAAGICPAGGRSFSGGFALGGGGAHAMDLLLGRSRGSVRSWPLRLRLSPNVCL